MAGVHAYTLAGICAFCYFTPKAQSLFRATLLVTLYYVGTWLVIVRAGYELVPPTYLAFLAVGTLYNLFAMIQTNKAVEKFKDE